MKNVDAVIEMLRGHGVEFPAPLRMLAKYRGVGPVSLKEFARRGLILDGPPEMPARISDLLNLWGILSRQELRAAIASGEIVLKKKRNVGPKTIACLEEWMECED